MQDKQKEYVDRGWAEMEKLLDQEMPRRRYGMVGWWLVLLVLLLAGWIGVRSLPWRTDSSSVATTREKTVEVGDVTGAGPAIIDPRAASTVFSSEDIPSSQDRLMSPRVTVGPTPELPRRMASPAPGEDQARHLPAAARSLSWVPVATLPRRFAPAAILGELAIPVPRRSTSSDRGDWHFLAEAATQLDFVDGQPGFQVGLLARKTWGRWSVRSGFRYAFRQIDLRAEDPGLLAQFGADVSGSPLAEGQIALPNPLRVRSQQWHLLVGPEYRLAPRWRLGAGLVLSYWARNQQVWTLQAEEQGGGSGQLEANYTLLSGRSGQRVQGDLIHPWAVASLLDIHYLPDDRWEIGLSGYWSWRDQSLPDGFQLWDRHAQLQVRYRFGDR